MAKYKCSISIPSAGTAETGGNEATVDERDGLTVIIDVLRASSTIVTAMARGVSEVKPLDTDDTRSKGIGEWRNAGYLLAGEYRGVKLPGFEIGNSPTELIEYMESGHRIEKLALKTTNFTTLLYRTGIETAYICSTLNIGAVVRRLMEEGRDRDTNTNLVAVGSRLGVTEDLAVAMALYGCLNDGLEPNEEYLRECIIGSRTAKYLAGIGYWRDVVFISSQIDRYEVVPVLNEGVIRCE